MLAVAYVLSVAYQHYRYTLHEHPADTFGLTEVTGYAVCLGWSCLALVERRWAVRATLALCALQLGIAFCYYFPLVFATRHGRFWDWAEAVVFVALIGWAGYRSVARLAYFRRKQSQPELVRLAR
jgi:hypothetical protein